MLAAGGVTVTDAASCASGRPAPGHQPRRTRPRAQLPASPTHELTVVIPVRDRPDQLDRSARRAAPAALRRRRRRLTRARARSRRSRAATRRRARRARANVGPAGARNAGLATVTTPYVAFVDSDVEVAAADLLLLARHFADPAVGPRRAAGHRRRPVRTTALVRAVRRRSLVPRPSATVPGVVRPAPPSPGCRAPAWSHAPSPRRRLRPRPARRRGRRPRLAPGRARRTECATTPRVEADHDARPTIERLARPQVLLRQRRRRTGRTSRRPARTRRPDSDLRRRRCRAVVAPAVVLARGRVGGRSRLAKPPQDTAGVGRHRPDRGTTRNPRTGLGRSAGGVVASSTLVAPHSPRRGRVAACSARPLDRSCHRLPRPPRRGTEVPS